MAYMDVRQESTALPRARQSWDIAAAAPRPPRFSPLEWMVVAQARREARAGLARPSRLSLALGRVIDGAASPRFADPRLEALRRVSVLMSQGHPLPAPERKAFYTAGFNAGHLALLRTSLDAALIRAAQFSKIGGTA